MSILELLIERIQRLDLEGFAQPRDERREFVRRAVIAFSGTGQGDQFGAWERARALWNAKPEDC